MVSLIGLWLAGCALCVTPVAADEDVYDGPMAIKPLTMTPQPQHSALPNSVCDFEHQCYPEKGGPTDRSRTDRGASQPADGIAGQGPQSRQWPVRDMIQSLPSGSQQFVSNHLTTDTSRPSRYRGQQNSPLNGLLFRIVADSIGLCGRAPAHYPMLKNSNFRIDHNSGDRWRPR